MKIVKFIFFATLFLCWGNAVRAQFTTGGGVTFGTTGTVTTDQSTWKSTGGPVYLENSSKLVGIGTSSPSAKLHIVGDVLIPSEYSYSLGSTANTGDRLRLRYFSNNAYIDYAPNLYFRAGTTPFVSFTSTQRVGIRTQSPAARLQINGEGDPMLIEAGARGDTMHLLQLWGTDQALFMGVSTKRRVSYLQSCDIWTASNTIALNPQGGSVTIGTLDAKGYKLAVAGNMVAEQIYCKLLQNWPDFVFAANYSLKPLSVVEQHIKEHKHLPDVPSATEVEETGIDLGKMNAILLQKIEELTLYLIEQNKKIEDLQQQIDNLQK